MGYRVLADQTKDFEPEPMDESTETAASKIVCGMSEDVDDARVLLEMLGLIPGSAPGDSPTTQGSDSDVLSELSSE